MRRTLSITVVTIIAILAVIPAQASWVSEMLWGRHREYTTAGITYAVDEKIPARWSSDSVLSTRYWKEGAPVFSGTVLRIGVLLNTGTADGRKFAICVSDPNCVVGDLSGRENFDYNMKKDSLGGLRILGTFGGKYGVVDYDTTSVEPGTIFLYTYALKGRKYEKFSEQAIMIPIAPPLEEVLPAMRNEPEEVLRQWGLESYPTLEEVVGSVDSTPSRFNVYFADGGKLSDVDIAGKPSIGRYLGVFTSGELTGVARVDSIEGETIRSNSKSQFLTSLTGRESQLRVAWVVKVRVYTEKVVNRSMTPEQYKNWMSFPDSSDPNSSVFGLRNAVREMYDAGMVHLNEPYKKNTSLHYWQMYQGRVPEYTWSKAPEQEAYVPCAKMREVRCVRLAPGGIPVIKLNEAKISKLDTQGLWPGVAYIIGQRVHRPDRIDIKNTANAPTNVDIDMSQSQQQQQQQQQDQSVAIDP